MSKNIQKVILDAGPLITQPANQLQQFANEFYTTPGVFSELKDENVRQQLIIWGDQLKIIQPKQEYINQVSKFARLTGDYNVLSMNDIHIIALAYQFEIEFGKGESNLRKIPGEILQHQKEQQETAIKKDNTDDDGFVKPKRKRGGRRQREKREAEARRLMEEKEKEKEETEEQADEKLTNDKSDDQEEESKQDLQNNAENNTQVESESTQVKSENTQVVSESTQVDSENTQVDSESTQVDPIVDDENNDSDDDGEWITPENLQTHVENANKDNIQEDTNIIHVPVALATGDFACQNVAMQININLLNTMSGKQIKRIRNYMYRCHACFKLTPISKDGKPKHFCPKCGGNTLLRCAVSIDNKTGKIIPHLKQNFQWINRGDKFSLPSPLSKNQIKKQGKGGFQHNKENRHKSLQTPLIFREDQKEYHQAMKNDAWEKKQKEKLLQEWIGGGSADNVMSPFGMNSIRPSGVKVGKGRYVNSSRGKKK
ncbi:unnamed protein product [Candida verbasci]|uniref:20S-pre-rRNA D-site endonuclease NOB1 n=1 Tax=Candida verbasci TaxID=1227364 RepID=A0A9W4TWM4_9ASCO|nr:unnamed protein product [Candida verbasci]